MAETHIQQGSHKALGGALEQGRGSGPALPSLPTGSEVRGENPDCIAHLHNLTLNLHNLKYKQIA